MNKRNIIVPLAIVTAAAVACPMTAMASSNFDLRRKVIGISGIMNVVNIDAMITRGEFAQMLVNASPYRSTVSAVSSTSVFADVPRDSEYAASIRIAAEQGFMTGYLGGLFKPDSYVTLQEAARGVLALLGYQNSDFTGDQSGARLSKFYFLELNDQISREAAEVLNREDCINLFYNLLKAKTTAGKVFGESLGFELSSDGEINPLTAADNSLKGPKVIRSRGLLADYLPFSLNAANIYLDGEPSSEALIKQALDSEYLLIYYHPLSKTVWAYTIGSESNENQGRYAVTGVIENVIYSSSDVMTPSAIRLDGGDEYELTSSDMQFAFSMYGDIRVGDEITLVYTMKENGDGDAVRTVIDYIGE